MAAGELYYAPSNRLAAIGLTGMLAVSCAAGGAQESVPQEVPAVSQGDTGRPADAAASGPQFEVTQDWASILPTITAPEIAMKTVDECYDKTERDEDGRRAPLANENPPVAVVDGSCNYPVTETFVGVYPQPEQITGTGVRLYNGDLVGLECVTEGQPVQDERGPVSSSNRWFGTVSVQPDGQLLLSFAPSANIGYPDPDLVPPCPAG